MSPDNLGPPAVDPSRAAPWLRRKHNQRRTQAGLRARQPGVPLQGTPGPPAFPSIEWTVASWAARTDLPLRGQRRISRGVFVRDAPASRFTRRASTERGGHLLRRL